MKILVIVSILLMTNNVIGQINISPDDQVKLKIGEFSSTDLESLKSTTTLFIYRESDEEDLELFKSTLEESWDYTELEFISYEEYTANTYDESYSFFTIGGIHKTKTSSSGMVTENTYIYLMLWMIKNEKKLTFCRIDLYPTFEAYQKANTFMSKKRANLMMKYLYAESTIHNWNLVYLKNSLQFVNKNLDISNEVWLFNSETYEDLSPLKSDTLYILDYALIKFAPFTGDESARHNVKKLLKKYPHPYKFVSATELAEKITNSTDSTSSVYYLSYVKSCTDKFISVFNGKTGDLLYSDYSPVSYNVKAKDFAKLSEAIE